MDQEYFIKELRETFKAQYFRISSVPNLFLQIKVNLKKLLKIMESLIIPVKYSEACCVSGKFPENCHQRTDLYFKQLLSYEIELRYEIVLSIK